MVPITRRASFPNKKRLYFLINNKPILIRSMLAASSPGHVCWRSCKRTKEAKRRQLKATFTVTSTGTFTAQARKSSVSLLLNLIRKTLTRACVLETDVHIYIYISRVSINMTK